MSALLMLAGLFLAALYLDPWAMAVLLAAIGGVVILLAAIAFVIHGAWTRGLH